MDRLLHGKAVDVWLPRDVLACSSSSSWASPHLGPVGEIWSVASCHCDVLDVDALDVLDARPWTLDEMHVPLQHLCLDQRPSAREYGAWE